jgi:PEP-CTERM motif
MKQTLHLAVTALMLALCSHTAHAQRSVRIDSGPDFNTSNGEYWPTITNVTPPFSGFVTGQLPFQLNFGEGTKDYDYSFSRNGFVQLFARPGGGAGTSDVPPMGNFIAPFAAFMVTGQSNSMEVGIGVVDTTAPYVQADAKAAIRFTWKNMCVIGVGCDQTFQVVLLDRGAGDFDLEMNYGFFDANGPTLPDGEQGFHLGSNVLALHSGPFTGNTSPDHYFRNGVVQTTTVPEPGTYALALAGLGIVGFAARARRRA